MFKFYIFIIETTFMEPSLCKIHASLRFRLIFYHYVKFGLPVDMVLSTMYEKI